MAVPPDLDQRAADLHGLAGHMGDDFPRDRARRHPARGLAGRGPAAAAIIAHAIFGPIGVIGMAGAELAAVVAVILASAVLVLDQHAMGVPVVRPFEHAGEDAHLVAFLALADEFRLAGPAAIQTGLDIGFASSIAAAQPSTTQPMAGPWLSPQRGEAEEMPEAVMRHRLTLSGRSSAA